MDWGWSSFFIQLDYGLKKEWKAGTIPLAHTMKVARAVWLQLQTQIVLRLSSQLLPSCTYPQTNKGS